MRKILGAAPIALLCAIMMTSCADIAQTVHILGTPEVRPWTVLVYMAADNNLEAAALHDINEMESVLDKNAAYSVLVLLDRAEGWDGTNGNWEDTRLYEIKRDPGGYNGTIISKRLRCTDLDLTPESQTELDMADSNTLKGFLTFAAREYPSKHSALIIWGHGTGWRSAGTAENKTKAVAIDDKNNTYMNLPSLKHALGGMYFDVIGFDTCFGATFETAYELSDSAEYLAAPPGIIPTEGWDYAEIFSRFDAAMTGENFCDEVLRSFKLQYSFDGAYAISKLYLPAIKSAAQAFCAFTQAFADAITTNAQRDEVDSLLKRDVKKECAPTYPSDLFLDARSLVSVLNDYAQNSLQMENDAKEQIMEAAAVALEAINAGVVQTIREGKTDSPSISVFFSGVIAPDVFSPMYSSAYIKDSGDISQSAFVKNTEGWTPTQNKRGSLLDKIFYTPQ
jgi:hypothetical protein